MSLPVYELMVNENDGTSGVYAVSLVDNPAIETNWIALSKDEPIKIELNADETKYILTGPFLIPEQRIYRKDNGFEYEVFVSENTIRQTAQKFLRDGYQGQSTHQHLIGLEGNTVIESWIVEDTKQDKSAVYGYSLPKGTWMISLKVDNKDYWDQYIKTGIVRGFSLEGLFNQTMVQAQKQTKLKMISNFTIGEIEVEVTDKNVLVISSTGQAMPEGEYDTVEGYEICINSMGQVLSITTPVGIDAGEDEDEDMDGAMGMEFAKIKKMKGRKKMGSLRKFLKLFGFEFADAVAPDTTVTPDTSKSGTPAPEVTDELSLPDGQKLNIPAAGVDMTVDGKDGKKYQVTIVPVIVPVTDPAQSQQPVENPVAQVPTGPSVGMAEVESLKAELAKVKTELSKMNKAPEPVKLSQDGDKWQGSKPGLDMNQINDLSKKYRKS